MNTNILKEIDWRMKVFDSLSYPSLVMTPDKIIVSGNQVFLDKFKTTLADIVGKACHEVFYSAQQCPNEKCPLPMVMAEGPSRFTTQRITAHLLTNAWVVNRFFPGCVQVKGREGRPGVCSVEGRS